MDARKCISYLTIELRGSIPEELREPMGHHIFGCDICQDVCPWNRRAPTTMTAEFQPRDLPPRAEQASEFALITREDSLFLPKLERLLALSEAEFRELFRGSPIKRTKWRGLVRNACIAAGNSGLRPGSPNHARICRSLSKWAASDDPVVAESAQWALSRIQ
jgi:epoxyqueuosine reductase